MNILRMTDEELAKTQARIQSKTGVRTVRQLQTESDAAIAFKATAAAKKRVPNRPSRRKPNTEDLLALQLREIGLELERQYAWLPGRKYKADFAHPKTRLLVEMDGGVHRIRAAFDNDIRKSQDAVLNGWRLLRVGKSQVKLGEAADIVRRAIDSVGNPPF